MKMFNSSDWGAPHYSMISADIVDGNLQRAVEGSEAVTVEWSFVSGGEREHTGTVEASVWQMRAPVRTECINRVDYRHAIGGGNRVTP